ncbi:S8 family peptidase [Psychrobacter sanguinis]|uniref:S8 family peptidase n=1 Tax=Psychrobacter sanguinis TaxID=861445 RepID=UPI002A75415D|nr:S8 family peptidase [Psychrobacter sanguinis]MDY3306423.1 S8 family peptidase [Psychrobacter sanguinis]
MNIHKPHLIFDGVEKYSYYRSGYGGVDLVDKDTDLHGRVLLRQLNESLEKIDSLSSISLSSEKDLVSPLTSNRGMFLSVVSDSNANIDVDKFDNTLFELKTLKEINDTQVLTFYTPNNKKDIFLKKVDEFASQRLANGKPKNLSMFNNISLIRPSTLEDLWVDDNYLIPINSDSTIECEVWINFVSEERKRRFLSDIDSRIFDFINESHLSLPTVTIFKAEATRDQLDFLISEYPEVVELRASSENPSVFIDMDLKSQHEFTEDFNERIFCNLDEGSLFVTILDSGVNYNNRLLKNVCKQEYCEKWEPNWPDYTDTNISTLNVYHGSFQAGVAAFGANLLSDLVSSQPITLTHEIESGRILPPPPGFNKKELYGAITLDTINKLISDRPFARRVYSLAVTAEVSDGYPSSWSATIDNFCYDFADQASDIFVISAGNAFTKQRDYWTNARNSKVQDPAQAWNAITVGSCTKLYNVTNIPNPTICSDFEDINPTTSSSYKWEWSGAPIKPEILCEGGNRLIHPDGSIDFHEDLSLLTASGKTQGNVFESHTDTSAATAEASYIAAKIMSEYPDVKSETIRGLLIHSAEWSKPILDELSRLASQHPKNTVIQDYKKDILSVCGYGIPNLEKAINSQNNRLSLIIESSLKPFDETRSFKLNEFNLHDLPWPERVLKQLPLDSKVKMTVTLSYYIEPNPRVSKIKSKYVYRSHGLSFELCKPGQSKADFIDSINRSDQRSEDYTEHAPLNGWFLGSMLQKRGSVHKDYWEGTAADLAELSNIVIKPVTGWWKLNKDKERCQRTVDYSLIVTLEVDDNEVDIYSEVESQISLLNQTQVLIDIPTE